MRRFLALTALLAATSLAAETFKPPQLNDPALKVEAIATYPDVETPTTVVGAPDGSVYVGNDPRDSRLNTIHPECTIVRFSELGADRKRTVFADKIYSPAGMQWHDGWLYVMHDPLFTRFKDTDGDGVADVREDLISSIGNAPQEGLNDHNASGFTLGLDGRFYISLGDRGAYQAKGADGALVTLEGGGILRVKPDGRELEIFSSGTRNHLQVLLDAEDNAFTLDNTDDGNGWWTRLTHHIAGGYYGYPYEYQKAPHYGVLHPSAATLDAVKRNTPALVDAPVVPPRRFLPALADFGGGSPTGGLVYLSDGLPEEYRGKLFFCEWGQRRISVMEVAREGAGFRFVKNEPVLQEAKGASFRPVQMNVANDGSLLIADWGFGGWKSPREVGAVWRLSWPDANPAPRVSDEKSASVDALLAALAHPDRDQRMRAQFALRERGEAEPKLILLMLDPEAPLVQRIHAMWSLALAKSPLRYGFNPGGAEEALKRCFTDPNAALRAQAFRVVASQKLQLEPPVIISGLKDADPAVRLRAIEAMVSLCKQQPAYGAQTPEAAKAHAEYAKAFTAALLPVLAENDVWLRFSARTALREMAARPDIFAAFNTADAAMLDQLWFVLDGMFEREVVEFLAAAAKSPDAAARARAATGLGSVLYQPKPWDGIWWGTQPAKSPPTPAGVAWTGTSTAAAALSTALADADSGARLAAAKALSLGRGPHALPALRARLSVENDPAVRRQLIETLGIQKDPEAVAAFSAIALDEGADPEFRDAAIGAVANIGGEASKRTIAELAAAKLSEGAMQRIIAAAGENKVLEAAPALIAHLEGSNLEIRVAAAKALGLIGAKAKAAPALMKALRFPDKQTQRAALTSIGSMEDPSVLPELLEFGKSTPHRPELLKALNATPDPAAIPLLVNMLADPESARVRRTLLGALIALKSQSWPAIEKAIADGTIPPDLVPEIKAAFQSGVIGSWKIVGPFENVWGASHPPEHDVLAGGDFLSKKYENALGQTVGWTAVEGDAERGWISLDQRYDNTGMICAYAYTEIHSTADADARLFCGSNDQIAIWLNGKKVHDFSGTRPFVADSDEVPIRLVPGKNTLLVKMGNASGTWEFAARIPGLDGTTYAPSAEPSPEEKQRNFALATKPDGSWQHPGDPARGSVIFHDPAGPLGGTCAQCHIVRGKGGTAGPDLSAIAANYKRADLIVSIHEPSRTIALGFDQFAIETKGGDVYVGSIRKETADELVVVGVDQQSHTVKSSEVKSKTPIPTSVMPPGLTLGLQPQDFADLLAYLETLKGQ